MHFKQSLKNMEEEKMSNKVLIFGKDAWPYTRAAREAFAKEGRQVDYYDVKKDNEHFGTMLKHSKGERKVPVIVEGDAVTIGFDGGTWAVWFFRLEAGKNDEWRMSIDEWPRNAEWRMMTDKWRLTNFEGRIEKFYRSIIFKW